MIETVISTPIAPRSVVRSTIAQTIGVPIPPRYLSQVCTAAPPQKKRVFPTYRTDTTWYLTNALPTPLQQMLMVSSIGRRRIGYPSQLWDTSRYIVSPPPGAIEFSPTVSRIPRRPLSVAFGTQIYEITAFPIPAAFPFRTHVVGELTSQIDIVVDI